MSDRAKQLYACVGDDRAAAIGLPRAVYVDPDVHAIEIARVLKAGWLPVARVSDVGGPGDYRCVDLLDSLLVVARMRMAQSVIRKRALEPSRGMSVALASIFEALYRLNPRTAVQTALRVRCSRKSPPRS